MGGGAATKNTYHEEYREEPVSRQVSRIKRRRDAAPVIFGTRRITPESTVNPVREMVWK